MRTIASNMPEMQIRKSDSWWSHRFGVGRETRHFSIQKKLFIMKCQRGRQTGMDSLERISNGSSDLGYRNVTSSFQNGIEPLDPIIYHGFPDLLKRYQLHKNESAPWSYLVAAQIKGDNAVGRNSSQSNCSGPFHFKESQN